MTDADVGGLPSARAPGEARARDRRFLPWRPAATDDAEAMARIYNETIANGGHSPQWHVATPHHMVELMQSAHRGGWPIWCLLSEGRVVAWAWIKPLDWGTICRQTGNFSVYVARDWHGSAAAMQCVLIAYDLGPRHGFEAGCCWILGTNPRSLQVARAARMQPWGCLRGAANLGGLQVDVHIWGARYDDADWRDYMNRLRRRLQASSDRCGAHRKLS